MTMGLNGEPLPIKATVTVAGDEHLGRLSPGVRPQVLLNLNCPFASTVSAALAAVKDRGEFSGHSVQPGS